MGEATPAAEKSRSKFTKTRAILAGGLVLGVGAAVTLAAWNDSQFASGEFAAGSFGIEGSADGTTFSDNPDPAAPGALDFEVDADALAPGDVVYENYSVQLTAESTNAADVTVTSSFDGDNAANLTSSFVYTTAATCDADAFAAGTDANVAEFELAAVETPTNLCIAVTAGDGLIQGAAATVTFEFDAVSAETLA